MSITLAATLIGGVGLFLLGMGLMTHGLKLAAGQALRKILGAWTRTVLRGVVAGFGVTALVQSSSAVTVAVIGFVNAGLLTLAQSIGVIYGSNIGTTVTGWIVAAVGLDVDLKALALPLVGLGMILQLTGKGTRRASLGEALAGFGIFFLGIEILQQAFQGLGASLPLDQLGRYGFWSVLIFLGVGCGLTILMQSSSAAMAVVLTAAAGGFVDLTAAAAAVIGANLGTTSTAALSVLGATANAKRVAAAHVVFNAVTAATALILLPIMLPLLEKLAALIGPDAGPAVLLALFHTMFNVLGVAVMWPLTPRLVRFLRRRVGRVRDEAGAPRYLDKTVLAAPELALDALALELARIGETNRSMAREVLAPKGASCRLLEPDKQALDSLIAAVRDFCASLQQAVLPAALAQKLPAALRICQYHTTAADLALELSRQEDDEPETCATETEQARAGFVESALQLLQAADAPCSAEFARSEAGLAEFGERYHQLKAALLADGGAGRTPIAVMVRRLERYSAVHRMIEQNAKAAMFWAQMRGAANVCPNAPSPSNFAWNQPW
ncbi:MAG: Na/Pi cotransporter family protein [Desulfovibrionaceae bacterium]